MFVASTPVGAGVRRLTIGSSVLVTAVSAPALAQPSYEFRVVIADLCFAGSPALNSSGQLAFLTSNGGCPDEPRDAQIVRADVEVITKIFGIADQTEFEGLIGATPSINDAGIVAFSAARKNTLQAVILTGSGGGITQVAANQPLDPAFPFSGVHSPSMHGASDAVVFQSLLVGQFGDFVFRASGGTYTTVAGPGTVVPGLGTLIAATNAASNGSRVLFKASHPGGLGLVQYDGVSFTVVSPSAVQSAFNGFSDLGVATWMSAGQLFKGSGGAPTLVAAVGSGGLEYIDGTSAINRAGQVVFTAWASGSAQPGVYTGPDAVTDELIGPGDVIAGLGTVQYAQVGNEAINNVGQIALAVGYQTADGRSRVAIVRADPATDSDADGLPNDWETQFGLNPGSSASADGASGDPDGDGRTNAQELADGTHPRGFFQRYLAEGATSPFFKTRIALLNTGTGTAHVQLRYLKGDGTVTSQVLAMPALRRQTIDVATLAGLATAEFSTVVEADDTVVVDRTMTWDDTRYGSHAESGVRAPAPIWYLAEGSTAEPFSLFYLIQNPDLTQTATVRVTFLKPDGTTAVKTYNVGPKTRFNVWVNQIAEVGATDVSGVLETTNNVPIIVERAMYLSTRTQVFAAGHESAGVTAPATSWFLAEGATGPFFDEFVLIANPNATAAQVRATYLLPTGVTLTKDYTVPATSRFNIWVDEETFSGVGKALADTAVSVTLTSLNGASFIAERAMWWPGTFATWAEAHNSPGATVTGIKWALAEGEVGAMASEDQTDTYVLLANTSATAGTVKVTLLFEDGTSTAKTYSVSARSRFNVWVKADFPSAVGKRFGALIESLGTTPAQLVVERAMYSNANGVTWAAGTNALATRLQ